MQNLLLFLQNLPVSILIIWGIFVAFISFSLNLSAFPIFSGTLTANAHRLKEGASKSIPSQKSCLNINLASPYELVQLKGIGKVMAIRIVEHREIHEKFHSLDDLDNVKGLGEKKISMFKDELCQL